MKFKILKTRFPDNNSRQNVDHFSGNRGKWRGAHSSQTGGRGKFSFPSLFVTGSNLYILNSVL
jgi:hypothetical protein